MEISAKILKDSVSPSGVRITTFELVYHRYFHSEVMTHRVASKNASSSRAVPIKKFVDMVLTDPATPTHWGANQAGMQASSELTGFRLHMAKFVWKLASKSAAYLSLALSKIGVHKQIANRLTEPFQYMKVVFTATELDNFFHLRAHPDAQPEFQKLAYAMKSAVDESTPQPLYAGEWHLPYITTVRDDSGVLGYFSDGERLTLDAAQKISASCCAQVSYRILNTNPEKAEDIFNKLIYSDPVHASPTEHQATPIIGNRKGTYTHKDVNGNAWSGNLRGWSQYRHLVVPKLIQQHKTEQ